jgi:thiol-disulfide isomerase/thioredoxin
MSGRRARRERAAKPTQQGRPSRRRLRIAVAAAAGLLAAAAAVTLAFTSGGNGTPATGSAVSGGSGSAPLELSGTDPISGRSVSLAAYTGKPIVLNMWASWCTGCYAEAHALARFERTHPQAQVVGVDIQDTRAAAIAFYRRFGWHHPSIFDPDGLIATRFQLQGLPATLFLDRHHRIVARILGETDLAGFDQGLQQALS